MIRQTLGLCKRTYRQSSRMLRRCYACCHTSPCMRCARSMAARVALSAGPGQASVLAELPRRVSEGFLRHSYCTIHLHALSSSPTAANMPGGPPMRRARPSSTAPSGSSAGDEGGKRARRKINRGLTCANCRTRKVSRTRNRGAGAEHPLTKLDPLRRWTAGM